MNNMRLSNENLKNPQLAELGYLLPQYDRQRVCERTYAAPTWVHMGAGNIFRSFIAHAAEDMLNSGALDTGIIVAEGFDYEIIEKAYRPFDNLCVSVTLCANGSTKKNVVGSITESLMIDSAHEDWARLQTIFTAPTLQMVSFTITEKGYNLKDVQGNYFPSVLADFAHGTDAPQTYLGKVAALCHARFLAGKLPLALVSMDNCSHNGARLQQAISDFAVHWAENGKVSPDFAEYITGNKKVSFPWTAIDKITPRPDASVQQTLIQDGLEDIAPIETARHTFVAPFVNAEETQYLIIENHFPNAHPQLEAEGIYFGSRQTVEKFEQMKVCTCLNPLHTALAVLGCMMKFKLISAEMQDADLRTLVERIAFRESMPVVVDPGIIDPVKFAMQVINERLTNPFIPDAPQRIACDTSQKLAVRFGNTIRAYQENPSLDVSSLKYIPFVLAAWCRYLLAVDDDGDAFEPSPDPMLALVQQHVKGISLGEVRSFRDELKPILSNEGIFGVNLYEVGLADLVEHYFTEMVAAPGAIRKTLHTLVS